MSLTAIIEGKQSHIELDLLKARIREFQGVIQSVDVGDDDGDVGWFVENIDYLLKDNFQIELTGWRGDTLHLEDIGDDLWSFSYDD